MENKKSVIALLLAAALWAIAGVFVNILGNKVLGYGLVFINSSFGALVLFLVSAILGKRILPAAKDMKMLVLLGFSLCGSGLLVVLSYYSITIGQATLLFCLYPVFTLWLAKFQLGEKITKRIILATFLGILGAAFIAGLDVGFAITKQFIGVLSAIGGGLLAAVYYAETKYLSASYGYYTQTMLALFFGSLLLLPVFILFGHPSAFLSLDWLEIVCLLIYASIVGIGAPVAFAFGAKGVSATAAGIILLTEGLFAVIFGAIFLAQYPSWFTVVGGALILSAAYLVIKN